MDACIRREREALLQEQVGVLGVRGVEYLRHVGLLSVLRGEDGEQHEADEGGKKVKCACYVGTKNVYADIIPSLKSLLIHSDVDKVFLLIEDDEFPYPVPSCVQPINVSGQKWILPDGPNYSTIKWTWMTMMRAALAKLFPDIDLILSMDNDTIVNQDISEIWRLPVGENYYAASREPKKSAGGVWEQVPLFTQMGVVLYNLKRIREDGIDDLVIHELNTNRHIFAEQDAFNELCQGHIYPMPADYNVNEFTEPTNNPKIYHYAATNGRWRDYEIVKQYRDIPWSEIRKGR